MTNELGIQTGAFFGFEDAENDSILFETAPTTWISSPFAKKFGEIWR